MLPDKTRYSKVKPEQIPGLIDKHLWTNLAVNGLPLACGFPPPKPFT